MQIVVAGEYNSRKQFVVRKYSVIGKTKITIEFEAMKKTLAFARVSYLYAFKPSIASMSVIVRAINLSFPLLVL